jgi:hypothetical protein
MVKGPAGYEGWYAPSKAGDWRVRLKLPEEEARRLTRLEVNGKSLRALQSSDGAIELRGKSAPGTPLRWSAWRA